MVPRALGVVLVLLAAWLIAFDLARVTIRQDRLPRYVAACLLAGYFWLGLAGALIALATAYDAALHAFFVGFVFSMVFGHAPVILPAVLRCGFPTIPCSTSPLHFFTPRSRCACSSRCRSARGATPPRSRFSSWFPCPSSPCLIIVKVAAPRPGSLFSHAGTTDQERSRAAQAGRRRAAHHGRRGRAADEEGKVGAVLVVDEGRLVGIFTERDALFRVIAPGLDPRRRQNCAT